MEIHQLQEKILRRLMKSKQPLRYGEIRIRDIPNDQFNYHLQTLKKKGFIQKDEGKYALSKYGQKVVEEILALGEIRPKADKFRFYVHAIVVSKDGRHVISRERKRHPFFGDRGIHGISIRHGIGIEQSIIEFYKSNLSIEIQNIQHCGFARKTRIFEDKIFSDTLHYICVCDKFFNEPNFDKEKSHTLSWRKISSAIQDETNTQTPIKPLIQILKHIEKDTLASDIFLREEETFDISKQF
jgi:hypothetical protein